MTFLYLYQKQIMKRKELEARGCTPIEDWIAEDFGAPGTPPRAEFDNSCDAFIREVELDERIDRAEKEYAEGRYTASGNVHEEINHLLNSL